MWTNVWLQKDPVVAWGKATEVGRKYDKEKNKIFRVIILFVVIISQVHVKQLFHVAKFMNWALQIYTVLMFFSG